MLYFVVFVDLHTMKRKILYAFLIITLTPVIGFFVVKIFQLDASEPITMNFIITKTEIYYDPSDKESQISYDDELMKDYNEFRNILDECYDDVVEDEVEEENKFDNKWIIRIEMDEIAMLDMNITNEES